MRWPFLAALALAVCGLGVRYTVLARGATGPRPPEIVTLSGVTGQGTSIEIGVREGRVWSLNTSLNAECAGGSSWHETWQPTEGNPVHFTITGQTFVTHQYDDPTYPDGVDGSIGFAIRGTLTRGGGAQGTIRLAARFYRAGSQWNACDSLDVAWAVGPKARARLSTVRLGSQVNQYYAAVPTLATDASPARRSFASQVDDTCDATYNEMAAAANAAATRYRNLSEQGLLNDEYYVRLHEWQYGQIASLGQPPQARGLYDAWLDNFRHRVSLEVRALDLEEAGRLAAAKREDGLVTALKAKGDVLGQEFGLVRCTSNVGTAVPVLNDGQPPPLP